MNKLFVVVLMIVISLSITGCARLIVMLKSDVVYKGIAQIECSAGEKKLYGITFQQTGNDTMLLTVKGVPSGKTIFKKTASYDTDKKVVTLLEYNGIYIIKGFVVSDKIKGMFTEPTCSYKTTGMFVATLQ